MYQRQGLRQWASGHRLAVVVVALLASVFMYAAPAQATPAAGRGATNDVGMQSRAVFQNYKNGQCLWHQAASNYNLYAVDDNDCGLWGTGWVLYPRSFGSYELRNTETGKCAYVNASTNNAPVKMYTCNSAYTDQEWLIQDIYYGGQTLQVIQSRYTGKCLVKRATDLNVVQYGCQGYTDQYWKIIIL